MDISKQIAREETEESLAQKLFIATFSNPILPPNKEEAHLKTQIEQCIKAAKMFKKIFTEQSYRKGDY